MLYVIIFLVVCLYIFCRGKFLGKPKSKPKPKAKSQPPQPAVPPLTDEQAECYLQRHPDLQNAFDGDIDKAKAHWLQHGHKEGRSIECPPEETFGDE